MSSKPIVCVSHSLKDVPQPPLVGREQELRFLGGLMDAALARKGAVILVAGEAGVGKSRLCEEFGKIAVKKSCEVIVGRCVPGAPSPFLPFQDAFSKMVRPQEKELGLRQWIRGAGPSASSNENHGTVRSREKEFGLKRWMGGPDLNPESESERTLHSTLELLRRKSAKHAIVLVLEDLHWADSPSIQLLHFIARNSGDLRLLLVGTYRPEDLAAEESGRVHPLLDSLRVMRREQICQEITLDPLNLEELRLAIEGMLGGSIDPAVLKEIASESGGNPLFAVETVRLLLQTGSITPKQGVWQGKGRVPVDVPSTVKEVILRRIDRLPTNQRRLLECGAVVGETFDPTYVERVLRLDRLNMLETLDLIGRNSQLLKASDGLYRFSHEKIQRTTYDEISSPRRKELHRMIAEVLESQSTDEALYGQLALHFCASGEKGKCIQYSLLAGHSSLGRFGTAEAVGYFEKALELAKEDPTMVSARLQALEGIGDAHKATGLNDSAMNYYQSLLKLSLISRDKARVMRKCAECWLLSDASQARELLDQAEKCEDIEKVEFARITKLRGIYAAFSGELDQAQHFLSEAQKIFESTESAEDLAKLYISLSDLHISRGLSRDALESAEEAVRLYTQLQSPVGEAKAQFQLGSAYWNLGRFDKAAESYTRTIGILERFGRYPRLAEPHIYMSGMYTTIGNFEPARIHALKAREYALKTNSAYWLAYACFILAFTEVGVKRIAEGEKWYMEGSKIMSSLTGFTDIRSPIQFFAAVAEAELLNGKGDWEASKEKFRRSIELCKGAYYGPLHEAIARTRFGEAALTRGLNAEAEEQFSKAAEIYERLGNEVQLHKLRNLLGDQLKSPS